MNKKGFTIVELIAVIALLAVIGTIFGANMIKMLANNKELEITTFTETITSATDAYVGAYPDAIKELSSTTSVCIKISDIQNKGFLDKKLKDPSTGELISDKKVKVTKDAKGVLSFQFNGC